MFKTHSRRSRDFSIGAYERFDTASPFKGGPSPNVIPALGHFVANIIRNVLDAMYESRRQQAVAMLERYGHLIGSEAQTEARALGKPGRAREAQSKSRVIDTTVGQPSFGISVRCSITGAPCEGDRAHLCVEWGCARKGGLSPISHENF
jgi:hypothetical protein